MNLFYLEQLKKYVMIDLEKCLYDPLLDIAALEQWGSAYAFALTMKEASFYGRIPLDDYQASCNLSDFLEMLNNSIFSSDDLSKGCRVRCIPILEIGEPSRYLFFLEKPDHVPTEGFMELVANCWWGTDFADWKVDIDFKLADADWMRHLTELRSDPDWDNYWNPH